MAVAHVVKQEKDAKGKVKKEGYISLFFIDAITQRTNTRIVISKTTAKALAEVLKKDVETLEKELKSKKTMKAPVTVQGTETRSYIG